MEEDYQASASSSQSAAKKVGKQHNTLPLWGNEATMNLNPLILANIQSSSYFKVHLFKLKTYHEVVDEIYYQVKHMEPWERGSRKTSGQTGMCGGVRGVGAGGIVSTAYCLLYKLYTLRLTRKQVNGLINHTDSPFIRALGFMYLRYTQPPADLYDWYEDYLQDEEEIDVKAGGGQAISMGQMVYQFLTKLDWFSTLFPRIPVPIQKQIEKKIEQYCRENTVTVHQLSAGPGLAATNTRANRDEFEPEPEGEYEVPRERGRGRGMDYTETRQPVSNYRGEHDDRGDYRTSSTRDNRDYREYKSKRHEEKHSSPESVYRGTSRERERYREKHKKKHKHKHHSRSRSRSRSHSRSHSDRKRTERDYHHHHRSKGHAEGYPEDKRYR